MRAGTRETDGKASEPTGAAGGRAKAGSWGSRRLRCGAQLARATKLNNRSNPSLSCEVDVVRQSRFSGSAEQLQQVRALRLARTPANQHDQARKRLLGLNGLLGQGQKMRPIATDDEPVIFPGMAEDLFVGSSDGERLTERYDIVAPMPQQVGHFGWHVVVEQESHASGSAICSATKASISVRWSS